MKRTRAAASVVACLLAGMATAPARAADLDNGQIGLTQVGTFADPTYVTSPPGDPYRLFVTERAGRIMEIRNGTTLPEPFLDLTPFVRSSGAEQGLLSIAFAPDYGTSGNFYVMFTAPLTKDARGSAVMVERFRRSPADPDRADPASARRILYIRHPASAHHNGGQLEFGPDGDLYVGVGDGGYLGDPQGNGQNPNVLFGKILRIGPRPSGGYSYVPGNLPDARPEVFDLGFRNPWRFSFDRATRNLFIGDVGEHMWEEVDWQRAGTSGYNYGWPRCEGSYAFSSRLDMSLSGHCGFPSRGPVVEYPHTEQGGECAVTGGYVVRDPRFTAENPVEDLTGRYVFADYCAGQIQSFRLFDGKAVDPETEPGLALPVLPSFGQDAAGRIYIVTSKGPVYRIDPLPAGDAPQTVITSAPPGRSGDDTPTIGFDASDPGAHFTCALDGADFQACSSPWAPGQLVPGDHDVEIRAIDAQGRTDPSPAVADFTILAPDPRTLEATVSRSRAKVDHRGGALILLGCPSTAARGCNGTLRLMARGGAAARVEGRRAFRLRPARRTVLRVQLGTAARRLLAQRRRLSVVARADTHLAGGRTVSTSRKITLLAAPAQSPR